MSYGDNSRVTLARITELAHGRRGSLGIVRLMTAPRQGDLFGHESPDPSDEEFETPVYYPDPDKVREELRRILAEAKAARTMPWDARRTALYRAIFPQMTNCLPQEEGAQLRFDFETEMKRLRAA